LLHLLLIYRKSIIYRIPKKSDQATLFIVIEKFSITAKFIIIEKFIVIAKFIVITRLIVIAKFIVIMILIVIASEAKQSLKLRRKKLPVLSFMII